MTDSNFDAIHRMWEKATPRERDEYIFQAVVCFREEMKDEFKAVNKRFEDVNVRCCDRLDACKINFVSKKYLRVVGIIALVLVVGIFLGTGYLTWKELMMKVIPL